MKILLRQAGLILLVTPAALSCGGDDLTTPTPLPSPMIAFEARGKIFLVNPDGTSLTNLTSTSNAVEFMPVWCPTESSWHFLSLTA